MTEPILKPFEVFYERFSGFETQRFSIVVAARTEEEARRLSIHHSNLDATWRYCGVQESPTVFGSDGKTYKLNLVEGGR